MAKVWILRQQSPLDLMSEKRVQKSSWTLSFRGPFFQGLFSLLFWRKEKKQCTMGVAPLWVMLMREVVHCQLRGRTELYWEHQWSIIYCQKKVEKLAHLSRYSIYSPRETIAEVSTASTGVLQNSSNSHKRSIWWNSYTRFWKICVGRSPWCLA